MMRVFLIGLVFTLPVWAEREVSAMFFRAPEGAPEKAYLFDGVKNHELDLPRMNLSARVAVPAEGTTFVVSPVPVDPNNPQTKGLPGVKIGEDWEQCILLFFVNPKNETFPVALKAVNTSLSGFKKGELYWINLTRVPVGGKVGSRKLRLGPRKVVRMPAPARASTDYPVVIDCMVPNAEQATSLCRTTWRHDSEIRRLLFVLPDPGRRVPRIWSVPIRERDKGESGSSGGS